MSKKKEQYKRIKKDLSYCDHHASNVFGKSNLKVPPDLDLSLGNFSKKNRKLSNNSCRDCSSSQSSPNHEILIQHAKKRKLINTSINEEDDACEYLSPAPKKIKSLGRALNHTKSSTIKGKNSFKKSENNYEQSSHGVNQSKISNKGIELFESELPLQHLDKHFNLEEKYNITPSPISKKQDTVNKMKPHSTSYENEPNKSSLPSDEIRKSVRKRYPPFAYWKNERLKYRFTKEGTIDVLGIESGTKEDITATSGISRSHNKPKDRLQNSKKFKVHVNNKLMRSYSSVPWNDQSAEHFRIKIVFSAKTIVYGFIEIDGFKSKELSYLPEDDIHMTVINGHLEVQIQEEKFIASEKDMFLVPKKMPYSIKNLMKKKALLTFSVGKM